MTLISDLFSSSDGWMAIFTLVVVLLIPAVIAVVIVRELRKTHT